MGDAIDRGDSARSVSDPDSPDAERAADDGRTGKAPTARIVEVSKRHAPRRHEQRNKLPPTLA